MPKIVNLPPEEIGIYVRKNTYWLRHSVAGVQTFTNLRVKAPDKTAAIAKAKLVRGKPVEGKSDRVAWAKAISGYIADKMSPDRFRPKHLAGRPLRQFRPGTDAKVKSCLTVFGKWTAVLSPSLVTEKHLTDYYTLYRNPRRLTEVEAARVTKKTVEAARTSDKKKAAEPRLPKRLIYRDVKNEKGRVIEENVPHWKGSEAGAQAKIRQISAFLDHLGCLPARIQYQGTPEARPVKVSLATYEKWTLEAPTDELKYVLFCGFFAGLRGGEITYSRSDWYDLGPELMLNIPGSEIQQLPNGEKFEWRTKNGEGRSIPLSEAHGKFLRKFLKQSRSHCLLSPRRSKSGLWDWGTAFDGYMRRVGRPDVFPHAMRHSFITTLCNSGNHDILEIVAISGDDYETIEANYWSKRVAPGRLDATMKGQRRGDDTEAMKGQLAEILKMVQGDKMTADEALRVLTEGMDDRSAQRIERDRKARKAMPRVMADLDSHHPQT